MIQSAFIRFIMMSGFLVGLFFLGAEFGTGSQSSGSTAHYAPSPPIEGVDSSLSSSIDDSIKATLPTTVIITRHAEKLDDGSRDPELSEKGIARAQALADALKFVDVDALIASPFARTQETLRPISEANALTIQTAEFGPGGVEAHITKTVEMITKNHIGEVVVVAGHSNTVPLLVEALTGRAIEKIEENEYGQVFIVEIADNDLTRLFEFSIDSQ